MSLLSSRREYVPICELVVLGQLKAVEEYIQLSKDLGYKLDLNEKDQYGGFATMYAARRNDLKMLRLLVNNGARLDVEDDMGRTVQEWAEKHGYRQMRTYIEFYIKKMN